ncbi:hypothetical protein [Marispirochaeta aestuarii]|uniref:hypothetical protein n=1 Tax=Marispirochaeta aestuarii TaxID=1963862 RepID=UPI0029C644FD|nr:hypothetical protein [Marispirochaeta aestuarii]
MNQAVATLFFSGYNGFMPEYLWMLLPLLLVPLCMRFAVVQIVLLLARRHLLPRRLREMEAGWKEAELASFSAAEKTVRARLTTLFTPKYEIARDIREILLSLQEIRTGPDGEARDQLRFSFSVRNAAEVAMLAFSDIYADIHRRPLLRKLYGTRLKWLLRAGNISRAYSRIMGLPLIRQLSRVRLLFPLLRIALIPLVGLPMLILYLVRSMITGILFDGSFRYLYALVLLRISYYGIYLYGGENPLIAGRIQSLKKKEIINAGRRLEEILNPENWDEQSILFEEGAQRVNAVLRDLGIETDHHIEDALKSGETRSRPGARTGRILRRLKNAAVLAARRQVLSSPGSSPGFIEGIKALWQSAAEHYAPQKVPSFEELRLREIIAGGYFSSVLLLSRLYSAPGIRSTLGRISVEFAVRINELTEDELIRGIFTGARRGLRVAGIAGRIRRLQKTLKARYHPAALAFSFVSPFALAHIETSIRTAIYHRAARLVLYLWESNQLDRAPEIEEALISPGQD